VHFVVGGTIFVYTFTKSQYDVCDVTAQVTGSGKHIGYGISVVRYQCTQLVFETGFYFEVLRYTFFME